MRIGVIGLGFMGTTHLQAWRNVTGAEIVAVCSTDPQRLTGDLSAVKGNLGNSGEKFDFSRMGRYEDYRQLLADPNVEAVDICLPTNLHASVALDSLRAGKHVLVEKPMSLKPSEAEEMIRLAEETNRLLMAGQVLRFFPAYRATADAIKSGEYGPVRSAILRRRCAAPFWSKWLGDPSVSGGGVFDLLIHDVDYALHVFGKPVSFSATGYEDMENGVDTLSATLNYPDGLGVVITGGWHHRKSYPFSMDFTIVTDGGTFEFSSLSTTPGVTVYAADGEARALPVPETDGFESELRYFHECCTTGKKPTLCPPSESAEAVKLTLQLAAARKGRSSVVSEARS